MAFRFAILSLSILAISQSSVASVEVSVWKSLSWAERERQVWRAPTRATEFTDMSHVSAHPQCEKTLPPQALATPDPLLNPSPNAKVKVSFIVGADGRVYGPLILESAGPVRDRSVLRALRTWRYRPATCNGAPTEAEGRIEFSRR